MTQLNSWGPLANAGREAVGKQGPKLSRDRMDAENRAVEGQAANRARILLADDNPIFLERVVALVTSWFDVVGTAHNGGELISEAIRLTPDIIVADITMPVCNGLEAVHRLRTAQVKARVVFLTIHDENEFVDACVEEGALGYVLKPRLKTDLIPAIRAALDGEQFISPILTR